MTETGKAVTTAYYGQSPNYNYFSGCSRGGFQAMTEAQRYPKDYDGIIAAAPGINWPKYGAGRLWGQLSMLLADNFIPACKFDAVTKAAVEACDNIDGVEDNIIGNPRLCQYDPNNFVGASIDNCGVFTLADADIVRKSWQGPRRMDGSFMWYGFTPGTSLEILNSTEEDASSIRGPSTEWNQYFLSWHRYFLAQDPDLDLMSFTHGTFEGFWDQSVEQYSNILSADDPDLREFQKSGGKIIMWHGESDSVIPPAGSIDYYKRVERNFGTAKNVNSTLRLFMAPGVDHCGRGVGPSPVGLQEVLVDWVENNIPPERIMSVSRDKETNEVIRSRPLCLYPKVARYKGKGSSDDWANFECAEKY